MMLAVRMSGDTSKGHGQPRWNQTQARPRLRGPRERFTAALRGSVEPKLGDKRR